MAGVTGNYEFSVWGLETKLGGLHKSNMGLITAEPSLQTTPSSIIFIILGLLTLKYESCMCLFVHISEYFAILVL